MEEIKVEKEENILGTEKIQKLIIKFSIPCIISLLVNALYNIVDQIFIGWGVDYLANGATNVVFPLTMICLAFSLMIGDGASAYLSLKLGEKKKEESGADIKATEGEETAAAGRTEKEKLTLVYIGPSLPAGQLKSNKIFIGTMEEIEKELEAVNDLITESGLEPEEVVEVLQQYLENREEAAS